LELSYLRRLPDGTEMTGKNCRCIFGRNALFDKGKAFELYIKILIDYGCCATITGAKRRALIAVVVLMVTISSITDFSFLQMIALWSVNAWCYSEYQDIKRQYAGKKSHPVDLFLQRYKKDDLTNGIVNYDF